MANEAVIVELYGEGSSKGRPMRGTVDNAEAIEKGELAVWLDPRKLSGAIIDGVAAGVHAMEKVAADGSTSTTVYTDGLFDFTAGLEAITLGDYFKISGSNLCVPASDANVAAGLALGRALETVSASEVFLGRVNL